MGRGTDWLRRRRRLRSSARSARTAGVVTVPYLSRIWLNPWRKQTRRFIRDPQALHAAVLAGLPMQPVDDRILWRLDGSNEPVLADRSHTPPSGAEANGHRLTLWVVTQSAPSWEHLVEQAGWPSAVDGEPQVATRPYDPLLERLKVGDRFAFRLTANPTRSVRPPAGDGAARMRGKRVAHVTAQQQLDWLIAKVEHLGFEIPPTDVPAPPGDAAWDVKISNRQTRRFTKGNRSNRVTLSTATFDGHLVVRDAAKLRDALTAGVGPAKAYGCGLLTLAPQGS